MAITLSQKILKKLRASMHMDTLTEPERVACEARLKLTEKIDHILYTEWDPIGVHLLGEFDYFDEYHDYLPGILQMLREDASLSRTCLTGCWKSRATCSVPTPSAAAAT